MSYILDALKKAEAERERGTIPGLATNQANSTLYIVREGVHPAWWLAAVLLAAGLAYVFWPAASTPSLVEPLAPSPVLPRTEPTVAVAPVVVPVPAQAPSPATAQVPVAIPATGLALPPLAAPKPAPTAMQAPAMRPPPSPAPVQNQAPAQAQTASPNVALVPVTPPPTPPSTTVANRPPSDTQPIPALADLPEGLRRQLPAITISGAVYSDSPPEWALVINDQVLVRGGMVAPELRLEEVSGSSAVFSFRGQRFRMDR